MFFVPGTWNSHTYDANRYDKELQTYFRWFSVKIYYQRTVKEWACRSLWGFQKICYYVVTKIIFEFGKSRGWRIVKIINIALAWNHIRLQNITTPVMFLSKLFQLYIQLNQNLTTKFTRFLHQTVQIVTDTIWGSKWANSVTISCNILVSLK